MPISSAVTSDGDTRGANRSTGIVPFRMSSRATGIAYFQPSTRYTFVAPRFRLPCSRRSIPLNSFPTIRLLGIAPTRYESANHGSAPQFTGANRGW